MKSLRRVFFILAWSLCGLTVTALAQDDFDKFKSEFQLKASTSLGSDSTQTWDSLSLYISKKAISDSVMLEFNKSEVTFAASYPRQLLSPQPDTLRFKMPHIIKNCSMFDCCDCGWTSPWCCGCDAIMAGPKAACELAKATLDLVAGAPLGKVEFKDIAVEARIDPTPVRLLVNNDFSKATLNADAKLSGSLTGEVDIKLTTIPAVFTACYELKVKPVDGIPFGVSSSSPPVFENKLEPVSSDDGISVQLSLQKTSIQGNVNLKPVLDSIGGDPGNFMTCPVISTIGVIFDNLAELQGQTFNIQKSIDINPTNFPPQRIGQLSIDMPGRPAKTKLVPKTNSLALGVVESVSQ